MGSYAPAHEGVRAHIKPYATRAGGALEPASTFVMMPQSADTQIVPLGPLFYTGFTVSTRRPRVLLLWEKRQTFSRCSFFSKLHSLNFIQNHGGRCTDSDNDSWGAILTTKEDKVDADNVR